MTDVLDSPPTPAHPAGPRLATPVSTLGAATVAALDPRIAVPGYDRSALVPSVVHIGVGGFHRAHQALYFDDLAQRGNLEWGVVGVGLRRPEMGEVLSGQDCLYTVVERSADAESARVVGSIVRYLYAAAEPEAVVAALADPRTRLVTLTVTGNGYLVTDDGEFDDAHADVLHDVGRPEHPKTMLAYLVDALQRRRDAGTGPFTVLSCDNLPDSGAAARTAVVAFAGLTDPDLAQWIDTHVSFPSSMVDRITPETSVPTRDEIEASFGVPDRWPVVTEPFRQWVVEDDFCAGRPPLDEVGVQFVSDVRPYKRIKARLLNGGHSALGYLGTLAGHGTTDQAMTDPDLRGLMERLLTEEVVPLLDPVPGVDLQDYCRATLERFANPAIGDGLARLCRRGSTKMPSYVLPSLRDALDADRPHAMLVLAVAGWMRYLRGTDLSGAPVEVQDALAERLQALAREGGDDPRPLLSERAVFGGLGDDDRLVGELAEALRVLSDHGIAAAVDACGAPDDRLAA